ncbi:MAG: hypothetical protein COX90_03140 [Candidatus Nealsonbacteria bacterium CG_4_10_14_0_2_um_filter_38_17]|uniref:Uncharacterized protein n=1 Tax=Candidatus Nealsonbacteria bacterium CG_4_10_14_0_2_um_filter_38_17 TaxID=1974680 RepID=A0A2M7UXR9_9BACT|nr:MAG: hypothetical protein COX90_03140 [Candidatus Nealsonbacteria bacterium CG_4_10_14_0_2_um_filter_38_17]
MVFRPLLILNCLKLGGDDQRRLSSGLLILFLGETRFLSAAKGSYSPKAKKLTIKVAKLVKFTY